MNDKDYTSPLVDRLLELARQQDRGALAALRSGVGKRPGEAGRMFPYVAPFLPAAAASGPVVEAAFLTAALFAAHPLHGPIGSLGASLWRATKQPGNPGGKHEKEGVERRLAAALDAHADDLPHHLEGLITLCESAGAPVDWHQFQRDVAGLLSEWTVRADSRRLVRDMIRIRWARDFWRGPGHDANASESNEEPKE
jgi:CRISPR system Cascade subunit CasB